MRFDAQVVADLERGRVNEGEARAAAEAGGEKGRQWQQGLGFQLDKAGIAEPVGKGAGEMVTDIVKVEHLESAKAGGLKENEQGHDFAHAQRGVSGSVLLPLRDLIC